MKTKKSYRYAAGLLLAAFLCVLPGKLTQADMIWTPNDSFYEKNYEDCEYEGRRYYANGQEGYVTVREAPGKGKVLDAIANGPVFYVSMVYHKGMPGEWGVVQYKKDENGLPVEDYGWEEGAVTGWVRMSDLLVVYDDVSFDEEHAGEIKACDEENIPQLTVPESGVMYLWEFPGASVSYGTLVNGESYPQEQKLQFDRTYVDPDGDLWGHSDYYYGNRDFWINLSDPGQSEPKTGKLQTPDLIPPIDGEKLAALSLTGDRGLGLPLTAATLILLTILLTALIIRRMSTKKNGKR